MNGEMPVWFVIVLGAYVIFIMFVCWGLGRDSKKQEISKLKTRISDLEALCRFDNIPEFLIEHPTFIKGQKPTEKDIDWAKKAIEKYENKKA